MKRLLVYLPLLFLIACGGNENEAEVSNPEPETQAPLAKSQNSDAFNASMEQMLDDYYRLKDAMVGSTKTVAAGVDPAASSLVASADSLKVNELTADEAIITTARSYASGIAAEAKALAGEQTLKEKRKSFQMISDQMYDLLRTVKYDRKVVYHQYCPMAFNDLGAYWLSNEKAIRNPYFGDMMLECGEVKDSLDYRSGQ